MKTVHTTDTVEDAIKQARALYRRGYCVIDAAGNVGIPADLLSARITKADDEAHDTFWNYGPGPNGWRF